MLGAVLSVLFKIFLDVKSADYAQLVDNLIRRYETLGCRMSIKLHFLHSHLITFQEILVHTARKKVKDFTKTFVKWSADIKAAGMSV